jgi:hypothetical protein
VKRLEIHRSLACLELVAEIAQPLQLIIDIEKSGLPSHRIASNPSVTIESERLPIAEVLRVCPGTSSWITELSEHEADGGEAEESECVTGQVFKILGRPATPVEPGEGALDNPSFGQDHELSQLGPFNDFDFPFTADEHGFSARLAAAANSVGGS